MAEEQAKYGERLKKLWKIKYKNQVEFTTVKDSISRRTLNSIQEGRNALISSERRIADQLELPKFILKGYLEGEIEIDDDGNWMVKKTKQKIIKYKL